MEGEKLIRPGRSYSLGLRPDPATQLRSHRIRRPPEDPTGPPAESPATEKTQTAPQHRAGNHPDSARLGPGNLPGSRPHET
ncbi:hypothetical protein DPMN_073952 [Dreissena polymorpha]|uniref:Uncharacterized protein n=1 Tax=Dreissena polymorpha TaxID=45954 RepID=A0A9D3YFD0_DREPO|nr:hypothetical protein DPMN_073952 [Dreissena polymorpha]